MSNESAKGIDIRDAMSILSSRAAAGGDAGLHDGSEKVSEEHKSMGQTIDVFKWTKAGDAGCECGATRPQAGNEQGAEGGNSPDLSGEASPSEMSTSADEERRKEEVEKRRKEREVEIRSKLEDMSIRSLLNAVFEAQKERTMAYREYDRGLDTVISTGNITNYPAVCARATASFSVLSDTINTVRAILAEKHSRKDLAKLIGNLQQHEKEKLNATAALHLERIREKDEVASGGDERIQRLLSDGVVSLRSKVTELIGEINEVLEEMRYEMAEEEG